MKKLFIKFLSLLNTSEGIIHLIFAGIGFWGLIATNTWDVRLLAAPVQNVIFGIISIFTGLALNNRKGKRNKVFVKILAYLNSVEGVIHIIVSLIGFWGAFATGVFDIRVLAAPIENLVFGFFSIMTGIVLGKGFHHHH